MKQRRETLTIGEYVLFAAGTLAVLLLCVCIGSVRIPLSETVAVLWNAITGRPFPAGMTETAILLSVRLPRTLNTALTGAALSLCGGAMQGLLRNPLADGSTLGVSAGASLGAVIAIAFGITIPGLPFAGTAVMASLSAFCSLLLILSFAYRLDYSLSTNTIILIGVIFSMLVSSILSLIIALASDKVKHITFWTMGSLAGSTYADAIALLLALAVFGGVLFRYARELNAFAVGEENARHVGVPVRRTKLAVMAAVSALIGVCVSVGGTIGFVGLVTPHMVRMLTGPNHKRLLPVCAFFGAMFLMLCDLIARVLLSPKELPVGAVTSFIGVLLFVYVFYTSRRKGHA